MKYKVICSIIILIMVINFFPLKIDAATNWNNATQIIPTKGAVIYKNQTGIEKAKSKFLSNEIDLSEEKYTVLQVSGNRVKIKVKVSGIMNDIEGWVDKTSIKTVVLRNEWDIFCKYFSDKYDAADKNDTKPNFTIQELQRMDNGPIDSEKNPTEKEENGVIYAKPEFAGEQYYRHLQNYARSELETWLAQDKPENFTGTDDEKWESARSEADKLREEAIQATDKSEQIEKYQAFQDKLLEMRTYNSKKTMNDTTLMTFNQKVCTELKAEGITPKNVYDNQIDSSGNIVDGGKLGDSEIIYNNPELDDGTRTPSSTLDDIMSDADGFMNNGDSNITPESLQEFSKTLSSILLTLGIILSVIIGGILGIKFMLGSLEEKAQVKEIILPYIVGCIVIFGAFTIWKLAITLLSNI